VLGRENTLFFRAYHQLGMKQPILGSFNLSIPTFLRTAKGLMEGVAFIDAVDPTKPEAKAYFDAYKKEYGKKAYSLPAYGWDDMNFLVQAIKRAGSTDKAKICAALQASTGWVGALGAKGAPYDFSKGRAGFNPQGAVVRIVKNNQHGPVVYSGTK
jgi:branched-chain amino acid transport system substrate-binding protein